VWASCLLRVNSNIIGSEVFPPQIATCRMTKHFPQGKIFVDILELADDPVRISRYSFLANGTTTILAQ